MDSDEMDYGQLLGAVRQELRQIREDLDHIRATITNAGGQIRQLEDFKLELKTEQRLNADLAHQRQKSAAIWQGLGIALIELAVHGFEYFAKK